MGKSSHNRPRSASSPHATVTLRVQAGADTLTHWRTATKLALSDPLEPWVARSSSAWAGVFFADSGLQSPHPNVAKTATLGWGTLESWDGLETGELPRNSVRIYRAGGPAYRDLIAR